MKISVVGLGIQGADQLTLAAAEAIQRATKVDFFPGPAGTLEECFRKWRIENSENLLSFYHDGDRDDGNFQRVFEKVIADARLYRDVTVVVPGHPRVSVTLVQWLEKHRAKIGYELEVLPGISSFCTMINDLKRDPLESGSVLIDANRLLLYEYTLDSRLDYYLFHVCSVGTTRVHLYDAAQQSRLDLLKEYLLRFYPPTQPVCLIASATTSGTTADCRESTLGEMEALLPLVHFGSSLFLPAATNRAINRNYLQLLRNTQ